MLTNPLRTLAKDSRIETIDKFYVKKSFFLMFQCGDYTIPNIKFPL